MIMLSLLPTGLSDLFAQVSLTGKLTVADRYGMMAAILNEAPVVEELRTIDRILCAIRRGRIQLVDELSVLL